MSREAVAAGGEEKVMRPPVRNDANPSMFPKIYAPPWPREEAGDVPGDAGMAAVDKALNASKEFRRTLPPAAPLEASDGKRRWRDKPFEGDRKSTRLNSSHDQISYAVFCLKKKKKTQPRPHATGQHE